MFWPIVAWNQIFQKIIQVVWHAKWLKLFLCLIAPGYPSLGLLTFLSISHLREQRHYKEEKNSSRRVVTEEIQPLWGPRKYRFVPKWFDKTSLFGRTAVPHWVLLSSEPPLPCFLVSARPRLGIQPPQSSTTKRCIIWPTNCLGTFRWHVRVIGFLYFLLCFVQNSGEFPLDFQ